MISSAFVLPGTENVPSKDVRCAFVTLGRGAKKGRVCNLVTVSVGPKALAKGVKVMNNMIAAVKKGMNLKNRDACVVCVYRNTPHCT